MGLISFIETRSISGLNDPNMWINTLLESPNYATKSGVTVTADTALKISTVYACVTILSQTVASLPMTINRKLKEGGNEIAEDHYLFKPLHDAFNSKQTSYEAREMGIGHLKLRGNWFNRLERNGAGQVIGIWPLNPNFMQMEQIGSDIWYRYEPGNQADSMGNPRRVYAESEIWHVKGFSKDGLKGVSTIEQARESMGLTQALQDYSAQFFGNRAVPGNVLRHPGTLNTLSRANLKDSLEQYTNSGRHKTLILEEGMEWQSIGLTNKDAQYLELSNAQVRDIARWFNVPLILLQEPDKVSTYASAEQFMLSFVVHTISPIVVRLEQSANRALLSEQERMGGLYVKLNVNGLLRGDFKTRMDGYRIGRDGGWLCPDEIRALEDQPPIPDGKGKIYLQPSNFAPLGTEPQPEPQPKVTTSDEEEEDAPSET